MDSVQISGVAPLVVAILGAVLPHPTPALDRVVVGGDAHSARLSQSRTLCLQVDDRLLRRSECPRYYSGQ